MKLRYTHIYWTLFFILGLIGLFNGLWWLGLILLIMGAWYYVAYQSRFRAEVFKKRNWLLWIHSLLFIFILAITLRIFVFEIYSIPSASMANTLINGDRIIVSKLAYGPRLPRSIAEIPWLNVTSLVINNHLFKLDSINRLEHYRLKGLGKVQRGDVVVFHYPQSPSILYIKRCVGLPGDRVAKEKGIYTINGVPPVRPPESQQRYYFSAESTGRLKQLGDSFDILIRPLRTDSMDIRSVILSKIDYEKLSASNLHWKDPVVDHFIPFIQDTSFTLGTKQYFMMGDNQPNSRDSRYWGPVDENLIVGKAKWVLFSKNYHGWNWKRMGKRIMNYEYYE